MSKESALQVSRGNGAPRTSRVRSISHKARRIVLLCLVLLVTTCFTAIWSLRIQSAAVDHLLGTIIPVDESNHGVFQEMSAAKAALLEYQASQDLKHLALFRVTKAQVEEALVQLQNAVIDLAGHSDNAVESRHTNLEMIQREAVERWLAYSLSIEQSVIQGGTAVSPTEVQLFEGFRRANGAFDDFVDSEADRARNTARVASNRGITVVIAAALVTLLVMLVFGLRLARTISKPIIDLRDTMKRQREGDLSARAHENQDSTEIRDLAREFNLLVEHESELERVRSLGLRMHELTVKIEHAIRIASSTQQALEILCVELGTGFGVDRVVTNALEADLVPMLSAQWHRPDLPPLEDIPDELTPHISEAAEGLWKSSSHLVSDDRVAPEEQSERSKAFYRYTDARAAIVVPVGVGDQVIGIIYVFTTIGSRHWTDAEINTVNRVAAFLAQFIVEQTYRDQLNEHVERLEQLNRQKDTFVATVSHELRTPLTSIIGYLEVIKDGYAGDLTDEQARMLDVMDRNANRLLSLIQDLLALNKRESEAGNIEMVNVSMSELVTSVCHDLSPLAESGAIEIACEAGPQGAIVQGDPGKLQSAITNIVSNAIKFSPRGGVVTMGCTLDETNRRVQFTCQDRGIGIPAGDQVELFTRFYRASNAMTKFIPGTGLGLTIVKQIVDDHRGEIHLESVEGEGTTVVIDLPLSPQESF